MHLTFVYPAARSNVDGIQDYLSSLLAELELLGVATSEVRPSLRPAELLRAFWRLPHRGTVVLQYQPYAWGRGGFAPWLIGLTAMARVLRRVRLVLMVHETYIRPTNPSTFVRSAWQWFQLAALWPMASVRCASCDYYVAQLSSRPFRGRVHRLPVSSPLRPASGARTRAVDHRSKELVVATLLTDHPSQLIAHALRAAEKLADASPQRRVRFLVLGASRANLETTHANLTIERPGYLDTGALAERAQSADLFVLPFSDGITARRTTLMIALQTGTPVLTTSMAYSDRDLIESSAIHAVALPATADEFANAAIRFVAAPDSLGRRGAAARALFDERYTWSVIASTLVRLVDTAES